MPTKQELDDLVSKCDWTWTKLNDVQGYVVKGRDTYASASIFLPRAGRGSGTSLLDSGSDGRYLSSVPHSSEDAWELAFYSGGSRTGHDRRYRGQPVRAVQGFTE